MESLVRRGTPNIDILVHFLYNFEHFWANIWQGRTYKISDSMKTNNNTFDFHHIPKLSIGYLK